MSKTKKDNIQLQQEIDDLKKKIAKLEKPKPDLKNPEEYLYESNKEFRTFLETSDDLVFRLTRTGYLTYVSPRVEFLYGYKPDELSGKHLKYTTPIAEIPKAYKALRKVFSGQTLKNFEINQRRKDGLIIPMEINAVPIFENKKIIGFQGVMRDISERKKAELEILQSESRFKTLYESLGDAVFVTKIGGKDIGNILEVNPAAVKQTGYSRSELLKMNIIKDLYVQGSADIDTDDWDERLNKGKLVTATERKRRKDGTEIWTEVIVTPIEYEGVNAALSINHDITKRKNIELKLKNEIKFNQTLLQASPGFYVAIDAEGKIRMLNETFLKTLGYHQDEIIGKDYLSSIVPEKDREHLSKVFSKLVEQNEPTLNENNILTKDGRELLVEWRGRPVFNEMGEFEYFFGLGFDISERRYSEQIQQLLYTISFAVNLTTDLNELIGVIRKELGTLIDTTNFFVAIYDEESDMIHLPYIADIKDTHTSFPAGNSYTAHVIRSKKSKLFTKDDLARIELNGEVEAIGTLSKVWLGVPMIIKGKVTGAIVVQSYDNEYAYDLKDQKTLELVADTIGISIERKKAEQDIKKALEKATESDRLKSAFLATMSHELRTPLNAIIGFSDIIDEDLDIKDIVDYTNTINSSGYHLLSIVNDLFDITLIESGQTKIKKKKIKLHSILQEVNEIIKVEQQNINKTNLDLVLSIPSKNRDLMIYTDPSKLKQILLNLLKNALKFTNKGHVEFGYSIDKKQSNNKLIKFYVEDTGIGVPESKKELIFDIFRQAQESYTKEFGGTGIGLTISKKLTELLGGRIWLESQEEDLAIGKKGGTVFYFTLLSEEDAVLPQDINSESKVELKNTLNMKTILVVEDVMASYEFLKVILQKSGIKTLWSKNGKDAVEQCTENDHIDLVLMDINMPIMDGYESTRQIKKIKPELPIIAQTAYSIFGDREKSLEAGCDDYISKPIKKELLLEKINALISN